MKVNFARMTTETLSSFVTRILDVSAKAVYTVVVNNPLLVALIAAFADYFAVFDKKTYSGKGKEVAVADLIRDNFFLGMKDSLAGLTKMNGLSTQHDAIDLYGIFEAHGLDLYQYNYGDQSTHMDKLIEDLEKPENIAKIGRVHLTESYGLMKSSHDAFDALFLDQLGANSDLRQMPSATSLRNNMETATRNYLGLVTAMKQMPGWGGLYIELNEAAIASYPNVTPTPVVPPAPVV